MCRPKEYHWSYTKHYITLLTVLIWEPKKFRYTVLCTTLLSYPFYSYQGYLHMGLKIYGALSTLSYVKLFSYMENYNKPCTTPGLILLIYQCIIVIYVKNVLHWFNHRHRRCIIINAEILFLMIEHLFFHWYVLLLSHCQV